MEINNNQLRRNLMAYYVSRLDLLALVVVGVITIWLNAGMDLASILLLQGLFGLFIMILEFPSGVLADITSRRKVLIISFIAEASGLFMYLIGDSFLSFLMAEFFFAIALAFKSGSDTAMVFDSYAVLNREDEGEEVLAQGKSFTFASIVVLQVIGGIMAAISVRVILMMALFGVLIQASFYIRSVEPIRQDIVSGSETTRIAISKLRNIGLVRILLVFLILSIFLRVSFWDYIPRFEKLGLQTWTYGLLLSGANLVAWVTSIVVRRKNELQSRLNAFAIIGTIGILLWMIADWMVLAFLAIALHQITRGGFGVAMVVGVNKQAEGNVRASVHSLISAIGSGLYFLFSVSFELLGLGTEEILQYSSGFTLLLCISVILLGLIPVNTVIVTENNQEVAA